MHDIGTVSEKPVPESAASDEYIQRVLVQAVAAKKHCKGCGTICSQAKLARAQAHTAVRTGKIPRRDLCERCRAKSPEELHHPDYRYPLKVEWLCKECHQAETNKHIIRDWHGRVTKQPVERKGGKK
jgi:hypothetical protein